MRMNWLVWAVLSALFAAATALLAKVGVANVDPNLATAIRTSVILIFAWAIALSLGAHGGLAHVGRRLAFQAAAFSLVGMTDSGVGVSNRVSR